MVLSILLLDFFSSCSFLVVSFFLAFGVENVMGVLQKFLFSFSDHVGIEVVLSAHCIEFFLPGQDFQNDSGFELWTMVFTHHDLDLLINFSCALTLYHTRLFFTILSVQFYSTTIVC